MPDTNQEEQTQPANRIEEEPGQLGISEKPESLKDAIPDIVPSSAVKAPSPQAQERAGTVEHLAARRAMPEIDLEKPEIKQLLADLRAEVTRILTRLRWEGLSTEEAAEQLVPLLNVGPVQQWKGVLIPFLYEIDRGAVMLPVWLYIIEQGDPTDLPPNANPAETVEGRALRFAILMLGNYRTFGIIGLGKSSQYSGSNDVAQLLGKLATNPDTSLYAVQSLVKHSNVPATQALVAALKDAKGWAKVDVVDGIQALKQERFDDLLVASGMSDVAGLESYIAIPIYRAIPLENYLRNDVKVGPRLIQQAALIFNQVLQDSGNPPTGEVKTLPVVFERPLPVLAPVLFESARRNPTWQHVVTLHRLGIFLGRYWSEISRGTLKDGRILDPIYKTLPVMNEVERWMNGPGRDVLLETLGNPEEETLIPIIRVLGELREPRAISSLIARIEAVGEIKDRAHALTVGAMCDTLGLLGDRRAQLPILQLVRRVVNVTERAAQPKRRENLPTGDQDIPGSIVYAAAIRATGQLGDQTALENVLFAIHDLDPYVRTQALEAVKRLDPHGDALHSRLTVREALNDPRDSVVRSACQIVVQYRDIDAVATLRRLTEERPELATTAFDALRQLGQ